MRRRPKVEQAVRLVDSHIEALTAEFVDQLNEIVMQAQAKTLVRIQRDLKYQNGKVVTDLNNRRTLQGLADLFMIEMRMAGFDQAVLRLVHSMPGLVSYFQDVLNAIFDTLNAPPPHITFDVEDMQLAANVGVQTRAEIAQAVSALARQAQGKALFSFAAVTPSDLAVFLAKYTGQSIAQASALASTGLTTYYRTIADLGFREIEKDRNILYTYEGPSDILNRPFCHRILAAARPYSRTEIERMDNGTDLPVMTSCGGYRCRHQWVMYVPKR